MGHGNISSEGDNISKPYDLEPICEQNYTICILLVK